MGEAPGRPEHPLDPLESLVAKEFGAELFRVSGS